ncbi:hypothetical protein Pmar_PMAR004750, partial [Perkinsus marinus ATCC 50983]
TETIIDYPPGSTASKRQCFRLAGVGYDVLGLHPESCLAADLVRRIAGRWKDSSWDEQVALKAEEAAAMNVASQVLATRSQPCQHS